jgi:putative tricarboxylic transport membrane protein
VKRGLTVAGAVLVALGALALIEAFRLKDGWLGAKLMPAIVGTVLVALGVAHATYRGGEPAPWSDAPGVRRVALLLAVLALYVLVLPEAGFLPATAAFVFLIVRALGSYSWPVTAAWTAVIAVASHVVFRRWLGMPLPTGPFGL